MALMALGAPAVAEPLLIFNGRLFIQARVNQVPTEALLDSGAEATVVDPALAARAKLSEGAAEIIKGSAGSAPARIVEDVTVTALGIELHPEAVVVLDMKDISNRLVKRPIQAIVGRELFDAARLRIDIGRGAIDAVGREAPPPGKKLPLRGPAGIDSVPVIANGVRAPAELDLGNGSAPMVSRAFAKKLKLKTIGRKPGGGIGGAIVRDLVRLKSLEIGGARFRDIVAAVDDQPNANDLNVGTSVLKHFPITTDFKERAVWLEPVGRIGG